MTDGEIDPLLRRNDVLAVTGLSKTALYKLIKEQGFPRGRQITQQVVGWHRSTVKRWIDELPEAGGK